MTRLLPGVHAYLYDLSTLPEGQRSLVVGYVLDAKRGPKGANLVVSPTDFLTQYTFSGKPSPTDDPTYHSILKVLTKTNQVYVSRASRNALFGGSVIKRERELGEVLSISSTHKDMLVTGNIADELPQGTEIRLKGLEAIDGRYTVVDAIIDGDNTVVTVKEDIKENVPYVTGRDPIYFIKTAQPKPITDVKIGDVLETNKNKKTITIEDNVENKVLVGDRIQIKKAQLANGIYTVKEVNVTEEGNTEILVKEEIKADTTGELYRNSIATPEAYDFEEDDLCLITGKNEGAYNGDIKYTIISTTESPEALAEPNTMQITFFNAKTGAQLENPYVCSRVLGQKAIDGTSLYIEDVIGNSDYVQVINNEKVDENLLPCDTEVYAKLGGGFDGDELTEADFIEALSVFQDKTVPISLLGNGKCETELYQQAMLELANTRTDCLAVLSSRLADEKASLPSQKAKNIVNYKKNVLASTTFYGTMYAPHVKATDTFNSRTIKIAPDCVAIAGWLNTILTKGYPYAYAGPSDGLVTGVTTDWKIGDESGEATLLNDASVNYIAFDPKQGRNYMQCQNTLQIANSAMRNIGTVLNILDIKETFMIYFKEFLQKPITTSLRQQILDKGNDYMLLVKEQGRVTDFALQDTTTDYDMADNTLRYVLTIAPTPYAQNIYLVMNVVNQTFDFSILQSL